MARRKSSATVHVNVRMKEPLRQALEKAARRRGVSLNAMIVECLKQVSAVDALSEGVFGLSDLARFQAGARAIQDALMLEGVSVDLWRGYARCVDFGRDLTKREEMTMAVEAVRAEVQHDKLRAGAEAASAVSPTEPIGARRRPFGSATGDEADLHPQADHRWKEMMGGGKKAQGSE